MAEEDPRLAPGAYVTQDGRLYQVTAVDASSVALENCLSGARLSTYRASVLNTYGLAKRAPEIPDALPDDLR